MATVLFYTPFFKRARDVESLMFRFQRDGHEVLSLNQRQGAEFTTYVKSKGIETYEHEIAAGSRTSMVNHLFFLIKFCRRHQVDVVFSHLDAPNFYASIAQYFIRARVYLCRHHIDEAALYDYNRSWTYRLTNLLTRQVIVVSNRARQYMVSVEHVSSKRITHINLAYDFSLYDEPSSQRVSSIKNKFGSTILAVAVCRLTKYKRPELAIEVIENLRKDGLDINLMILGAGPMQEELFGIIKARGLEESVFLIGHVNNPIDYMAAADFVIHPSVLESSCVVLKEAGLLQKPVIACSNVGDVDEYIVNGKNGFLISVDRFTEEASQVIKNHFVRPDERVDLGSNLRADVLRLFSIDNVIDMYRPLLLPHVVRGQ